VIAGQSRHGDGTAGSSVTKIDHARRSRDRNARCVPRVQPAVYACPGGDAGARLALEVAKQLERLGAAVAVGRARPGRRVVAIEGCAELCASRRLREGGTSAAGLVRLDELPSERPSRLAELAAAELGLASRRERGGERYLAALLDRHPAGVRAAEAARRAGVTRAAAGEALERLRRRGLVRRRLDGTCALTIAGVAVATDAVRRRRIMESFLADYLAYPVEEVRTLAPAVADGLPDETVERLFRALGAPARCPHGERIDVRPRLGRPRPAPETVAGSR
jgi:Mn-dependent DtxR family transcriptional regulator